MSNVKNESATVETSTVKASKGKSKPVKVLTAIEQKAELAAKVAKLMAQMAELEAAKKEVAEQESAIEEQVRGETEEKLRTLSELLGLPDYTAIARACLLMSANDTLKIESLTVERETILNELPAVLSVDDLPTVSRCAVSMVKNGHLKAEKDSIISGERKKRVVLSDSEELSVFNELIGMQKEKDAYCAHCHTIEARKGMPGFQTLFVRGKELGVKERAISGKLLTLKDINPAAVPAVATPAASK